MNERTNKEGACTQQGGVKETNKGRARNKARDSYDVRRPSPENKSHLMWMWMWMWSKLARWRRLCLRETPARAHPRATRAPGTCDPRLICRWGRRGPRLTHAGVLGNQPSGVRTGRLGFGGGPPGGPQ